MRANIPIELFAGQVPQPFAVYRAPVLGMLGMLPSTFGIASYAVADLAAFRSVEEYATYIGSLDSRLKELDAAHPGQPLNDDERSEWATIMEVRGKAIETQTELRGRLEYLARIGGNDRRQEFTDPRRGPDPVQHRTSTHSRHVPEDIYALEQYRGLSTSPDQENQARIDGAKMAVERATYPTARDAAGTKEHILALFEKIDDPNALAMHILASGHPDYGRAVVKYATNGGADEILKYRAAQTLGTDTAGGFAVPFQLDPTLILTSDGVTNPIRTISRVEQITGKQWEGVTTEGVTAAYETTETPEVGASQAVLAQPKLGTVLADVFIPFSITLDRSWGSLQSELARLIQDAKDTLEAEKFLNGSGTNEPSGIVATMDPFNNSFVGGAFGVEDLFNLETGTRGLPPRFRPRASFLGNKAVYNKIRTLSVGSVGEGSVWTRGIQGGRPNELIGYPAFEASTMDADTANDGNDLLVFGDFNYFLIVDRIGLTIELIPHVFGNSHRPTNQRGVYAYWSNNSLILVQNAFRKLRTGDGS